MAEKEEKEKKGLTRFFYNTPRYRADKIRLLFAGCKFVYKEFCMKKGFTLTELLVVVIIIGVLSAVVLPKFNKVIETRKTTEAEELMATVRTEQEKRCAFDKNYLTDYASLAAVLPAKETKNFTYDFTSTGMLATSKGKYGYQLRMPSYADGRICCANDTETACLKLNKDYPLCSELTSRADYDNGLSCEGGAGGEPACTGAQPFDEKECWDGSKITQRYECVSGAWVAQGWSGTCPVVPPVDTCSTVTKFNWSSCCASEPKSNTKCWKSCISSSATPATYQVRYLSPCQVNSAGGVLLNEMCPFSPPNIVGGTGVCNAASEGKTCCITNQQGMNTGVVSTVTN